MAEPSRRWISPAECASYLGLHVMTVYEGIKRGEIPATRIGRAIRVDLPRLEKWLERREGVRKP